MAHQPRKRFGQNFLHDNMVIQNIVDSIHPQTGEHFVEIGPGKGAITDPLLRILGEIDVVELDRDLIPILHQNLDHLGELRIHQSDALRFDFSTLTREKKAFRVVGNLPYNISTPLLFHLTNYLPSIIDMHFMLQKEVVDRMAAAPNSKTYGRLSVMMQYHCKVEKLFLVKPGAFFPPPKVDSAIVRLAPHESNPYQVDDKKIFAKIVTQCFSQRRKTLRNNLKNILETEEIESLDINPGCRAETLEIEQFVNIANKVASLPTGTSDDI